MRANTRLPVYAHPGQALAWCTDPRLGSSAPTSQFASSGTEISNKAWPWLQNGSIGVEVGPTQPCEQAPNKPAKIFQACSISPRALMLLRPVVSEHWEYSCAKLVGFGV